MNELDASAKDADGGLAPHVEAWLRAEPFGGTRCEQVIETSISWLFLFEDRTLKLKKPLNLGFLDFSTLAKREWATRRELDFNRATAPDVYRRVLAITRDENGALSFDGAGTVVEWALEMRRFDETAVLANRLAALDGAFAENLGREIARFHGKAAPGDAGGGAAGLEYVLRSNARLIRAEADALGAGAVEPTLAATAAEFERLSSLLDRRLAQGFVRCCHGDLHLGNILLEAGRPLMFDCIEFNDTLREIDILYDIGFLLMDLTFRGAGESANRVLNGWLDEAARFFPVEGGMGLWEGLAVLALFQAVRATVRGHVNALEGRAGEARRYLAAARAYLQPTPPVLVAVGGLSGSGKTTLARALAPGLGASPGAVVLRSDEIRKRHAGRAPTERLPESAYGPQASARVYGELFSTARACLAAGRAVIADAVFLQPGERLAVEAVARESGATFHGLWLAAPRETLQSRIASRRDDASDADARVLDLQLARDPGAIDWSAGPPDASAGAVAELQRRLRAGPTPG